MMCGFVSCLIWQDIYKATVYVIDSASPEKKALWMAVLMGRVLLNEGLFAGEGQAGTRMSYCRASGMSLCLHLTEEFRTKHVGLTTTLRWVCNQAGSEWCMTTNSARARVALAAGAEQAKRLKRHVSKQCKIFSSCSSFLYHLQKNFLDRGGSGCIIA